MLNYVLALQKMFPSPTVPQTMKMGGEGMGQQQKKGVVLHTIQVCVPRCTQQKVLNDIPKDDPVLAGTNDEEDEEEEGDGERYQGLYPMMYIPITQC